MALNSGVVIARMRERGKRAVEAPKWFGQQGELAKWLVALSAGILTVEYQALKTQSVSRLSWHQGWETFWLAISMIALLVSVIASISFILASNRFELLRSSGKVSGVGGAARLRSICYPVMLLALFVGVFANGISTVVRFVSPSLTSSPPIIQVIQGGGSGREATLLAQRGADIWVLDVTASKSAWRKLPSAPSAAED